MKVTYPLFIISLACLSMMSINGVLFVHAKKANTSNKRYVTVVIVGSDGQTIVSQDSFRQRNHACNGISQLYFNFTENAPNTIRLYHNGKLVSESEELFPDTTPDEPEIIIGNDNDIQVRPRLQRST